MSKISIKQLKEAGVHYGHQTSRWNPKMGRFILGKRSGVHIIDLKQTFAQLKKAYNFLNQASSEGKSVLFVGTKIQLQPIVKEYALSCDSFYINERWLGGLLTNFSTVRNSVAQLHKIEAQAGPDNSYEGVLKKEAVVLERKRQKLEKSLGGVKNMKNLPSVIVIFDCKKEHLAIKEAKNLGIPIVAIADTNVDPSLVDFAIPGNDDATRSVKLFCQILATAVNEGQKVWEEKKQLTLAKEKEAKQSQKRAAKEASDNAKVAKSEEASTQSN